MTKIRFADTGRTSGRRWLNTEFTTKPQEKEGYLDLAVLTASENFLAFSVILANSLAATAFLSTNSEPTASAAEPAAMNSAAVFRFTPPVGIKSIWGKGPFRALIYFGPPTSSHGKIFTKSAPASQAVITSVGVRAPGITTLL